MAEKARCEDCDRTFKNEEGLAAHNSSKHAEKIPKKKKKLPIKKIRNWGIFIIILGLIVGGIIWSISGIENLPPTSAQGHIEESPESHILKEPIRIEVQRHMLEHSDGTGLPGVIINYNCLDYECEEDLIENLEEFAVNYPDNVYVTPFKGMDAKIALTREGRIEILKEFDDRKIAEFILRR